MVKIVIDAGHGLNPLANESEWNSNDIVVQATIDKLKTYQDVEVLRVDDPPRNSKVSPKGRTEDLIEWKAADVHVSIHHNINFNSVDITTVRQPKIMRVMKVREHGILQEKFHVLREPTMPAILSKGGTIDSIVDIIKLSSKKYLVAEGEAIAEGLAACIKLQPSSSSQHLIKEQEKLYKPTPQELVKATKIVLQYLEASREGVIPEKWIEKIENQTLNESDSIGLLYVVLHHWLSD